MKFGASLFKLLHTLKGRLSRISGIVRLIEQQLLEVAITEFLSLKKEFAIEVVHMLGIPSRKPSLHPALGCLVASLLEVASGSL